VRSFLPKSFKILYHLPIAALKQKLRKKIMIPEKKGQVIGGIIGLLIGCACAYFIWGFSSPGGIVILAGSGIGGLIGYCISKK
jgi:hypothetical protein